jgi:hypothetical protein
MEKIRADRSLPTSADWNYLPPVMEQNDGQSQEPRKIKSGFRNRNHFEKAAS